MGIVISVGACDTCKKVLKILARKYLDPSLDFNERFFVMRMMYGGQTDAHDFHRTGFDEDALALLLSVVGFCEVRRVGKFGLFDDTSNADISLNVAATACGKKGPDEKPSPEGERIYVSIPDGRPNLVTNPHW